MMYDEDFLGRLRSGLHAALPAWGLPEATKLRLLTISENATYLAETPEGERRIFRVHRPDYHTEAEIRSELAWIEALGNDGVVATPRPLPALDGRRLVDFFDGETHRYAVAFEFMSGREPDAESDLVRWYGVLGEITARLHQHSRGWARPEGFARKLWSFETIIGPEAHWGDWRTAPGLDADGLATLEEAETLLAGQTAAYGSGPERFGLVHCDMRTANLLVDGERLGVIDFDDCGLSWYAYDFAASVSFMEHEPFIPALMRAWVEGYRRVAPFSAAEEAALPMFVMLRRMQLTAWIASHAETPTAQAMGDAYVRGSVALAAEYLRQNVLENVA
ncbi:MAG: phosphotransferase [Acidocella sp.]|nr:phosphotransferase [Acidocella sp.]MDR3718957.1 phosphotransferase [Bryobacteraceae bacterium]